MDNKRHPDHPRPSQASFAALPGRRAWRGLLVGLALLLGLLWAPTACTVGGTCQQNSECATTGFCSQGQCTKCTQDTDCTNGSCLVGRCIARSGSPDAAATTDDVTTDQAAPDQPKAPDTTTQDDPQITDDPRPDETTTPDTTPETTPEKGECVAGTTRTCFSGDKSQIGVGVCKAGTQLCNSESKWEQECIGEINATEEKCGDGIDNNCDGKVDEPDAGCQCNPGEQKPCGSSTGACKQGTLTCNAEGAWGACTGEVKSSPEICDGVDNDCDGDIDEDFPNKGKACSQGKGECQADGKQVCRKDGTGLECSAAPGQPATEICNGKDDDCNGQIDEALQRDCYSGPSGTKNVGECKAGSQTCTGGQWSACKGEILPAKETCDGGKDNDCDGDKDEGCACTSGTKRACGSNQGECKQGEQICRLGKWGTCDGEITSTTEICDGKDNDCDGDIDEDFASKGKACSKGTGECERSGTFVCSTDGSKLVCNATPGKATTEVCDGKDNDCDGRIDESLSRACYTGPSGTRGKGLCKDGAQTCSNGAWGTCTGQIKPATETCDGKDNDCDGSIDENYSNKGNACSKGVGACKRSGTYVCKSDGSGTTCNASAGSPTKEVCDNKDNDCDGSIDESLSRSCYTGPSGTNGVGLCKGGTQRCSAGAWGSCAGQIRPVAEKCDGKDNDCDGSIDENYSNKGNACNVGVGACKRSGTYVCKSDGSGTQCSATPGAPVTETCNNKDDDCDGTVDEGIFGSCSIGQCRGFQRCVNGTLQCDVPDPTCCKRGQICP